MGNCIWGPYTCFQSRTFSSLFFPSGPKGSLGVEKPGSPMHGPFWTGSGLRVEAVGPTFWHPSGILATLCAQLMVALEQWRLFIRAKHDDTSASISTIQEAQFPMTRATPPTHGPTSVTSKTCVTTSASPRLEDTRVQCIYIYILHTCGNQHGCCKQTARYPQFFIIDHQASPHHQSGQTTAMHQLAYLIWSCHSVLRVRHSYCKVVIV